MKDRVDILLSVYNPNRHYLAEQLQSINNQNYSNIHVLIYDDCIEHRTDRNIFKKYITNFEIEFLPYQDKNLGYAKAFEQLIKYSKGDYVAFCDQDDVWHSNKISKSIETLKNDHSLLAVSNQRIIDQNDKVLITDSWAESHNKNIFRDMGENIVKYNIFTTSAPGMVMVLDGSFARSIIPVSAYTGHDKWALCCAGIEGTVSFIEEPLADYRRHNHNVSGILNDVRTKQEYYEKRVLSHDHVIKDLLRKYPDYKDRKEVIAFSEARKRHNVQQLKKYSYLAPNIARFEIVLAFVPGFLFKPFRFLIRHII